MSKSVAVIGARGYVGRALCAAFEKQSGVDLVKVERVNYEILRGRSYDVLINAAMPSKRLWAQQNQAADFEETVEKTADLVYKWKYKKFVQISSISARTQLHTVYGRHKAAAEDICAFSGALVIRLTSTFSPELSKGALMDILKGNRVFASADSRYSFASLDFVANWIASNLDREGIVEVGARNSLSLREIADHLKQTIVFEGGDDTQEVRNPAPEFPDAREVLKFLDEKRAHAKS